MSDIVHLTTELLHALGEDPEREGLKNTPKRVAKSLQFLTAGQHQTVADVVGEGVFSSDSDEMIILRDIQIYSLCEHHMLPFFGRVHVAYLPRGKILGVSKIARIVDMFARRLQIQERLANQIADAIFELLDAKGVGVIIEAKHFCMMMRGVEEQNTTMTTSVMLGKFRDSPQTRMEFLSLIK